MYHLKRMLCINYVGERVSSEKDIKQIDQNQTADLTEELLGQTIRTIIITKFEAAFLSTDLTGHF